MSDRLIMWDTSDAEYVFGAFKDGFAVSEPLPLAGMRSQVQTAVIVGGRINAVHYNAFRNDINVLYKTGSGDIGYGGSTSLPGQVSADIPPDEPTGTQYNDLRLLLMDIDAHQGASLTLPAAIAAGDIITALDSQQLQSAIDSATITRLNIGVGQFSLNTGTTATRAADSWGSAPSQIICEHRCANSTAENFRFYFNLGGFFAITPVIASGGNEQSVGWDAIFDQCGQFQIAARSNTRTGASGVQNSTNGVFDLTTSYVDMWTFTGTGAYTANTLTLAARVDVVSFSSVHVEIRCTLTDNSTASPDLIDRDITITPEARRSTSNGIPVPENETISRQVNL